MERMKSGAAQRRLRHHIAVAEVWLFEVAVSLAAGARVASWVLPGAAAQRGSGALGGEWFIVLLATITAYHITHKATFAWLEGGGGK